MAIRVNYDIAPAAIAPVAYQSGYGLFKQDQAEKKRNQFNIDQQMRFRQSEAAKDRAFQREQAFVDNALRAEDMNRRASLAQQQMQMDMAQEQQKLQIGQAMAQQEYQANQAQMIQEGLSNGTLRYSTSQKQQMEQLYSDWDKIQQDASLRPQHRMAAQQELQRQLGMIQPRPVLQNEQPKSMQEMFQEELIPIDGYPGVLAGRDKNGKWYLQYADRGKGDSAQVPGKAELDQMPINSTTEIGGVPHVKDATGTWKVSPQYEAQKKEEERQRAEAEKQAKERQAALKQHIEEQMEDEIKAEEEAHKQLGRLMPPERKQAIREKWRAKLDESAAQGGPQGFLSSIGNAALGMFGGGSVRAPQAETQPTSILAELEELQRLRQKYQTEFNAMPADKQETAADPEDMTLEALRTRYGVEKASPEKLGLTQPSPQAPIALGQGVPFRLPPMKREQDAKRYEDMFLRSHPLKLAGYVPTEIWRDNSAKYLATRYSTIEEILASGNQEDIATYYFIKEINEGPKTPEPLGFGDKPKTSLKAKQPEEPYFPFTQ